MPLYTHVVEAAQSTVAAMLANRAIPGRVWVTTDGGDTASMEKTGRDMTLNLPSFAPDTEMSRAEADRCVGYLVHEVAHQLHTDWGTWQAACRDGGLVRSLTNALEDVRIERLEQSGPWGGFGAAMAVLVNHMDHETQIAERKPGARQLGGIAADLPWLLALIGRAECNGLDIPGATRMRGRVAPALRPILDEALAGARRTQSTGDCLDLARRIARAVKEAAEQAPPPPPPPPPPPAKDKDEGAEGEAGGSGAGESTWTTDSADAPDPTLSADVGKGHTVKPMASMVADLPGYRVLPSPWDDAEPYRVRIRREALARSALLHDQVGQLVAAQEVRQHERRLTSGRFDRRAVVRAAQGALDVCSRRHVTPGCDSAVLLLLDLSGSMTGSKINSAVTMAMHLSEAVDNAGGHCAVMGFGDPQQNLLRNENHGSTLILFKDWNESPATGARRLANAMTPFGTRLSTGIIAAAKWMLATQDADRYLLGALTDGACMYGVEGVQAALRTAARLGVEPFGLGCEYDTTIPFKGFPRADVFTLADLPRVAMKTLLRELEARRGA